MTNFKKVFVFSLFFMLSACAETEPTRLTNIEGLLPELSFELIDENNNEVTEKDYLGQTLIVFFGFTNCAEVCPSAMYQLAGVLKKLGTEAEQVNVLFVSVDPKRDTPMKLQRYTDVFGPAFIGLTAKNELVKQMSKRYRVTFGYGDADDEGNYEVSHSGAMFIFDNLGRARLLATQSSSMEDILLDLRWLLNSQV
ncbi:MAG: SCO family protein [Cycloclasticus sp.]